MDYCLFYSSSTYSNTSAADRNQGRTYKIQGQIWQCSGRDVTSLRRRYNTHRPSLSNGTTSIVHLHGTSHKHEDAQSQRLVLSQDQAWLWYGVCLANTNHTPYHHGARNILLTSTHRATAKHGCRIEASLRAELVAMLSQNRCTHNLCCECSWSVSESPHIAHYLKHI